MIEVVFQYKQNYNLVQIEGKDSEAIFKIMIKELKKHGCIAKYKQSPDDKHTVKINDNT